MSIWLDNHICQIKNCDDKKQVYNGMNNQEKEVMKAYIDIETTGLSRKYADLTVIGVGIENNGSVEVVQLFDSTLNKNGLLQSLDGVTELYSYNGARFDLPFIQAKFDINLKSLYKHNDLMFTCWKKKLKGGLKAVEQKLGIERKLKGIDGFMAVKLYWDYVNNYNEAALQTLLEYNKEDVVNLQVLRNLLGVE